MAFRNAPHPEEGAERPSRRTHRADPAAATQRVCVGIVTGPQGVHGAVRIKSFTEVPEDIARYGPLGDEAGHRCFELQICGTAKGVLIARLSGVEDRNQAETLRGLHLYLSRSALPQTEAEEWYHADLIGLDAVLRDGTPVVELDRPAGPPAMVPFTRAVVPIVDLDAGRLVIEPPEGLFDPPRQQPEPRA
jgi:16S rRNA processing protein RimM